MQIVECVLERQTGAFKTADGAGNLCACQIAWWIILLLECQDASVAEQDVDRLPDLRCYWEAYLHHL
jgi:hypothetical protein